MTSTESQTPFTMWAMVAAPLMIGSDIRSLSRPTLSMLSNRDVIAVDQDRLGAQGTAVATEGNGQVWVKPLANGEKVVALLNRGAMPLTVGMHARSVGLGHAARYDLQNLWQHSTTETAGRIASVVPAHGALLYRVSEASGHQVPPSVVLQAPSITAPYPGSDLRLAIPGKAFRVSTSLANDGRTPLLHASPALSAPTGWQIQPSATMTPGTVPRSRPAVATWTVTPPAGALPGKDSLSVTARYTWGTGRTATATTGAVAQVPATPSAGQVYLSDQSWLDGSSGYLVPRLDQEVGGGPIVMLGHRMARASEPRRHRGSSTTLAVTALD